MLLLPKTPTLIYLKLKKIKDQKTRHFKLIYREILFKKATYTRHISHFFCYKLFYREIPLEKATYTRHLSHKKRNKLIYREIPFEKATYTRHLYHNQRGRRSIAGMAQHSMRPPFEAGYPFGYKGNPF